MSYVIEMLNITKTFPGIKANDNVTLKVKHGEIHALLGENGAGKSTLMSILFGLYQPDEGVIKVRGEVVNIKNPNDANDLKIGMVHQHFKLVENYTVLENIILGKEETKRGFLTTKNARKKIMEIANHYGLYIDLDAKIEDITVGMQQRVEILKMLYRDAEILIFDEPTAVLTPQEIIELMENMRYLIKEGKSIILITHKLNEIKMVADRCTILRKGQYIATVDVKTTTIEEMAEMMVGRKVSFHIEREKSEPGEVVLEVEKVNHFNDYLNKNDLTDVSFNVRAGEIVVVAGIEGNGQSQLASVITGLRNVKSGHIYINGDEITHKTIRQKTLTGISHIPEDRHKHGLILDFNLAYNLILQTYFTPEMQKYGFLKFNSVNEKADELIERFDIRSGQGRKTPMRSMSGGNQQKTIIARELSRPMDLVVAVQPTRGLDVGAIEYIHKQLINLRDEHKAILVFSLELDEVFAIADRILVMFEGRIVANLITTETNENELGLYMSGSKEASYEASI
ncbi:MAG: Galactose/methyl galactoside import ATP-binding protein MglA [Tenericutes bacterium ADurb.Bin239]|nr:MAG: Galactose/methyl galactoside import ATP-binding protein MglA [Tenericutes bacterium ADurb.Bin239]